MKPDSAELRVIRELLSDAFSSGEIDTLAFNLFMPVYRDFSPGMTRSMKVQSVVEYANDNGRIHDLLFYAERENPYQYRLYASRLMPIWQKLNHSSLTEKRDVTNTEQGDEEVEERKQRLSGESSS